MADKIVVMHDGRVEQVGAPLDLYDRPGNLFVAGFIGSPAMNFFPGTIRRNGKAEFAGPGGISLPLGELPQAAWRGRRQTRRLWRSPRAFHACRGRCGRQLRRQCGAWIKRAPRSAPRFRRKPTMLPRRMSKFSRSRGWNQCRFTHFLLAFALVSAGAVNSSLKFA
jgi:hypothetical protein